MSTDKDNHKSDEMKVEEKGDAKPDIKKAEANDVEKEVKDDNEDKSSDNESEPEPEPEKVKKESPRKSNSKVKETKKEEKSEDEEEENDEKDGDEEDDDDEENDAEKPKKADTDVPLLDQPLQVSGARERKKVERFSVDKSDIKESLAVEIPEGRGTSLGNIGIIENNISKTKGDELKKFHHVLFGRQGKATLIKKNIRKFNGFDFGKTSEQYDKKRASLVKLDLKYLKEIAGVLDLVKGGTKEDLASRLLDFLMEPKGAGTAAPAPVSTKGALTKGGRPKRSAATKANNKGYSDGSDEDDEDRAPRSRRANKGRRPNLKDESSSEDEKEKDKAKVGEGKEDDGEDEKGDDEKGSDVDALPEEETPSSDESDDPKSKKKRAPPPKASAKKSKKKSTPAKKEKPSPKKRKAESEEDDEDESSEDDQPLVKKSKTPPTDDDIKTYVKEILEGANLEEITMKTVCKQVYSHYPEFDLAHKKDFIKTTVKSLIST